MLLLVSNHSLFIDRRKYHPLVECQYQQIDCVGVEKNFEQFHGILIRRKSPDSGFDSFYENKPIYIQSTSIQETVLNGANEFLRQEAFGRHLKSLANRKVLKNISLSRTVVHREQLDKILKNGCPTVIGHKHSIIERKIYHRELMTLCDLLSDLKNQRHQMEYILMVFRTNTDPVSLAKLNKLKPDTQDVILIGNLIVKEITQVEILMDILDSKYEMMDRTGCTAAIKTVMESVDHFRKFRSRCINTGKF